MRQVGGTRMGSWSGVLVLAVAAALIAPGVVAADDHEASTEERTERYWDAKRFYFWFQTGHTAILDEHVVDDVDFATPNGINVVLGGGGGYNLDENWSLELQGHGTEPDVRSVTYGKVTEFSNITILPGVRFRWPIDGGPWVPWISAGIGGSLNDVNDTANARIKLETEDTTIAGSVAIGFDYFLGDNVAVGLSFQSLIYPDQEVTYQVRNDRGRVIINDRDDMNLTSVNALAHLRIFPGQQGSPDGRKKRRFLFADEGPFDTDDIRGYFYLFGGHTEMFHTEFGGPIEMEAPGDFNATLGGGLGFNFDRHWGAEVQLMNTDPNMDGHPYGKFAELSNFTVLPMVRFRWPFLDGRLVPFVRAGVGAAFFEINDKRGNIDIPNFDGTSARTVQTPQVSVRNRSVATSVQFGLEYFLNRNLSFGVSVPLYIYPELDTRVKEVGKPLQRGKVDFSGVGGLLEIRAYLP